MGEGETLAGSVSQLHRARRAAALALPPLLRAGIPEAGGPKLVCVHHRKFESYAVAFRWEHPVRFTVEATAIAAADAAPGAFRRAVLAVTGMDVGVRSSGHGAMPRWAGSVDVSEVVGTGEVSPELDLRQVVRALSSRPGVAVDVLEHMQLAGAVRLVLASIDPGFARASEPKFASLLSWSVHALDTIGMDALLDL